MAERRKPRKRAAQPTRDSKRLTLMDLPAAPSGESSEPVLLLRRESRSTLLPSAAESVDDTSLESLARAAHRASAPPSERASTRKRDGRETDAARMPPPVLPSVPPPPPPPHGAIAAKPSFEEDPITLAVSVAPPAFSRGPAAYPTEPSPPPDFGNSVPPPVQLPSEPPRALAARRMGPSLRTLGVVVLSATVGAFVSLTTWGVKSELFESSRRDVARDDGQLSAVALAASCAPASPSVSEAKSTAIAGRSPDSQTTSEAPRIAFDALPLQSGKRRGAATEVISLESSSAAAAPSSEGEAPGRHRAAVRERPTRDRSRATTSSTPDSLPEAPSRAAINQAVGRAASVATSCDSGPNDGKVAITFGSSGAVQSVSLVKGFGDATVNGCVLRAFGRARVPAFSGDPVVVKKSVAW
jgi:hypothetical protein